MNKIKTLFKNNNKLILFKKAETVSEHFINYVKVDENIKKIRETGILRRKCPLVDSLEYLIEGKKNWEIINKIQNYEYFKKFYYIDSQNICFMLKNNIFVYIYLAEKNNFAHLYHMLSSSSNYIKKFSFEIKKKGFSLKRDGIFNNKTKKLKVFNHEKDIYDFFEIPFVEPELREYGDEINLLKKNNKKLIKISDIKGVLHIHTTESDGKLNLRQIESLCLKHGFKYAGITDHSISSYYVNGLDEKRLLKQLEYIKEYNKTSEIKFLSGVECDIRKDGCLDYSNDILKKLDFVIVSVHQKTEMSEEEMTKRVIKAVSNPHVNILGHPTGRLLLARHPYKINMKKVFKALKKNKVAVEINCSPDRLDLDWEYIRIAQETGVLFSINPDAHKETDFENIKLGVNIARKGYLSARDVLNTKGVEGIL
ncbi:MAG: PHP domain-containing protein [Candidatus Muiribacteriota bacterium]